MFKNEHERPFQADRDSEDLFSIPVRAGKRTYFFDVKSTKSHDDYFLTITESKRKVDQSGGFTYDKHKIFLYKEDFEKFMDGLSQALSYIKENLPGKSDGETIEAPEPGGRSPKEENRDFTDVDFEEL